MQRPFERQKEKEIFMQKDQQFESIKIEDRNSSSKILTSP
jgi:hypothetical protein